MSIADIEKSENEETAYDVLRYAIRSVLKICKLGDVENSSLAQLLNGIYKLSGEPDAEEKGSLADVSTAVSATVSAVVSAVVLAGVSAAACLLLLACCNLSI